MNKAHVFCKREKIGGYTCLSHLALDYWVRLASIFQLGLSQRHSEYASFKKGQEERQAAQAPGEAPLQGILSCSCRERLGKRYDESQAISAYLDPSFEWFVIPQLLLTH